MSSVDEVKVELVNKYLIFVEHIYVGTKLNPLCFISFSPYIDSLRGRYCYYLHLIHKDPESYRSYLN